MAQVPSNLIPQRVTQLPDAPVASEDGLLLYIYNGNTYKIRAGDLVSVSGVPLSRQVLSGTSLQGGGPLSSDVTLSVAPAGVSDTELSATGVAPGVYGNASTVIATTVNAQGRVTNISGIPVQAVMTNVSGVLTMEHGGTGKNMTPVAGSLVYTDANSLQVSIPGLLGQVLVSGGSGAPAWGSALIQTDQPANVVYAGPVSGGAATTSFRALVNADLPASTVVAGQYGSATQVAQVAFDAKGLATLAANVTITPAFSSITSTPTTLAGYGINDAQPLDATLTAVANLVTNADLLPYFTGVDLVATTTLTAFARTLLDDVDAAAMQGTLGVPSTAVTDLLAPKASPTFTGTVSGITKAMVGLSNVDNTSNATERAAIATLTNKTLTAPVINSPTGIIKGDVGLGNVDNTSDATKDSAVATLTNKTLTSPDINGGTLDGAAIGETVRSTGKFTTLTADLISGGAF